jgi:hypothetical protein
VNSTFITIDVGELILFGQTFEVTVYENARLIFPCLFTNRNRTFNTVCYVEFTPTINVISLRTRANIPCLINRVRGFESISLRFL